MSFPVGLTTIQVTGSNVLGFDGSPLNGIVIFTASGPVADPAVVALLEGSATGEVVNGVMTPLTIPTTDCVSPGFTYTITQRLQTPDGGSSNPPPLENLAIPAALGPSVDLSTLLQPGFCG